MFFGIFVWALLMELAAFIVGYIHSIDVLIKANVNEEKINYNKAVSEKMVALFTQQQNRTSCIKENSDY